MAYVSPLSGGGSNQGGTPPPMHPDKASAYYISPIKGSQYTADYWKGVEQQNADLKMISDLKSIASGSMSIPYNQKIITINNAAKRGLIDKDTQLKLINYSIDKKNVGQPTDFWSRAAQWGAQQVYDAVNQTAKFANQTVAMANELGYTLGAGLAQAVGNKKSFQANQELIKKGYNQYGSTGGILNQGTVSTKQEAQNPTLKSGLKVAGAAANTLSQFIFPEGKAAVTAAKAGSALLGHLGENNLINMASKVGIEVSGRSASDIAKEFVSTKAGKDTIEALIKPSVGKRALTNVAHGAVQGSIYGGTSEIAQGKSGKEVLKGAAQGAAFGAGLGAAGTVAAKGVKALRGRVSGTPEVNIKESAKAPKVSAKEAPVNVSQKLTQKEPSAKVSATEKLKTPQEQRGVIQIINNKKGTKQYISPSTPEAYAKAKKVIDDARTANGEKAAIAGVKQPNGDIYHITARTPKEMEQRGFTKAGEEKMPGAKPSTTGKVAGGAAKLETRAINEGLTKEFKDKAKYEPQSYKKNAEDAANLVKDNPKKAMDIATGKVPGNNTIHESAVFHAVKEQAIKEGDVETIRKLAAAEHYTKTSEAAQKLGAEAYNASPHDPVRAIQEIRDARKSTFEGRSKTTVREETAKAVKAVNKATKAPTKNDWASMIEELRCK